MGIRFGSQNEKTTPYIRKHGEVEFHFHVMFQHFKNV
jgi:hypothetical protein